MKKRKKEENLTVEKINMSKQMKTVGSFIGFILCTRDSNLLGQNFSVLLCVPVRRLVIRQEDLEYLNSPPNTRSSEDYR